MTEPSVLGGMPTFEWNPDESVSYEVAVEAITQAVAAYTVLIRQAEQAGDADLVEKLTAAQASCTADRDRLRSTDHAQVAQVTSQYRELIDRLRRQAR